MQLVLKSPALSIAAVLGSPNDGNGGLHSCPITAPRNQNPPDTPKSRQRPKSPVGGTRGEEEKEEQNNSGDSKLRRLRSGARQGHIDRYREKGGEQEREYMRGEGEKSYVDMYLYRYRERDRNREIE